MKLKQVVAIGGSVVGLFLIYQGWMLSRTRWVPAGHVGVIYDAQGGLQKNVINPRAVFVGWRQELYIYPTQLQAAIYTQDPNEGEERSADGINITTNDNANTVFDVTVMYRVRPENVLTVFNEFGPIPIEDIQTQHIRRAVKEAVNVVGTRYDVFELMGPKREEASLAITKELQDILGKRGITVERAMLGACFPTPEVQSKITARVNSLTELQISRLRGQLADIEKQTALVQAQAQAESRRVSAAQVQGKSIEMLKLEATEQALKKWNGQLPLLESKPGQTIVIGRDVLSSMGETGGSREEKGR